MSHKIGQPPNGRTWLSPVRCSPMRISTTALRDIKRLNTLYAGLRDEPETFKQNPSQGLRSRIHPGYAAMARAASSLPTRTFACKEHGYAASTLRRLA